MVISSILLVVRRLILLLKRLGLVIMIVILVNFMRRLILWVGWSILWLLLLSVIRVVNSGIVVMSRLVIFDGSVIFVCLSSRNGFVILIVLNVSI